MRAAVFRALPNALIIRIEYRRKMLMARASPPASISAASPEAAPAHARWTNDRPWIPAALLFISPIIPSWGTYTRKIEVTHRLIITVGELRGYYQLRFSLRSLPANIFLPFFWQQYWKDTEEATVYYHTAGTVWQVIVVGTLNREY